MSVTIREAQQHYNRHTRKVLTDEAMKAARQSKRWFELEGDPVVSLGEIVAIRFRRNSCGYIYGEQVFCLPRNDEYAFGWRAAD